jgi:hypothetical protein
MLDPALLEPALLEPALLEPALLEPALLEPALLDPALLAELPPAEVAGLLLLEPHAAAARVAPMAKMLPATRRPRLR